MRILPLVLIAAAWAAPALASETITYTYDTHGRVVMVKHTGTVNNNLQTQYTHDQADNRSHVTTTNAVSLWGSFYWGKGTW